jgi:hypothetical protein
MMASKFINSELIIVDIQESFSKCFTDSYLKAVKNYCEKFDSVYQVWDSNHQDKPSYKFPNEILCVEKQYGFDTYDMTYQNYFTEEVTDYFVDKEQNGELEIGDYFPTIWKDMLVYVGSQHEWFLCNSKLADMFRLIKTNNKDVYIIGGADDECLEDIIIAASVFDVRLIRNEEYIYSAKYCRL